VPKVVKYKRSSLIMEHKNEIKALQMPIYEPKEVDLSQVDVLIKILAPGKYRPTSFRK
jgi:hypothetical protein